MTQEQSSNQGGESASPCVHSDPHEDSCPASHVHLAQPWQDESMSNRDEEFDLSHLRLRKIFTLIFIHDQKNQRILLGKKVRGPLTGQWNGFGGKVERDLDLSIADSAARELLEEAFLEAPLFPVGYVQWVVSPPESNSSKSGSGEQMVAKDTIYRDVMIVYKAHSFSVQQPIPTTSTSTSTTDTASSPGATNLQQEFLASDEMAPAWWPVSEMPWEQMRINHKSWYPLMLADRIYRAVYWYQTHYSEYDPENITNTAGAGGTNAQRETVKEIWVEDWEKRCIQFGPEVRNRSGNDTLPLQDVQLQQQHEHQSRLDQQQQEQAKLDEFAKALGLLMRDESSSHYGQSATTGSEVTKSSDPTWNEPLDENWMGQAIARLEKDWLL